MLLITWDIYPGYEFKNHHFNITATFRYPRGQWANFLTSFCSHPIGWWQTRMRGMRWNWSWQPMGYRMWRRMGLLRRRSCLQRTGVYQRYIHGPNEVRGRLWSYMDGQCWLHVSTVCMHTSHELCTGPPCDFLFVGLPVSFMIITLALRQSLEFPVKLSWRICVYVLHTSQRNKGNIIFHGPVFH